ncbi:MAG: DUF2147 domain-containing protein [Bacteroidota bacterium]
MKRIILVLLGLMIAIVASKTVAQTSEGSIAGSWYAEDLDESVIEVIQLKDGSYEGVIKSSSKEKYVGHKVIYGFKYNAAEKQYEGTISSAARNMEMSGTIVLEKNGKLKLTGRKFMISKTFYWERRN